MSCSIFRHGFRATGLRNLCLFVFWIACCYSALLAQSPEASKSGSSDFPNLTGGSDNSATITGAPPDLPDNPTPATAPSDSSSRYNLLPDTSSSITKPSATPQNQKWNWKASTLQTFEFTMFDHVWRAAFDPSLRYQLAHKPFFHDWFASYGGYNLHRWGDGEIRPEGGA